MEAVKLKKSCNSYVGADNITIKSSGDTRVSGAVVRAENNLTADVDGSLTVESLQDRYKSDSVTMGESFGGGKGSANMGVNFNLEKSTVKWVNEQTSLTAGGRVNIDVTDKTTLKGAVIASDTGDLGLATGSFEYSNIKDSDRSYNVGGGANIGGGKTEKGPETNYSVNVNYGFTDNRQTNFATVGEGTIIVRNASDGGTADIEGLNRDLTLAQYNTKEGGLKGGFTVDDNLVQLVTHPIETTVDTAKEIHKGLIDARDTTILIYNEAGEVVEKTGNWIDSGHYTTDDKLVYYNIIDEYNKLKATDGEITSSQEFFYIGARELVGNPLSGEELKETYISYIQKRGDEYTIEGAEPEYFNNYNTILLYDYYLDQKIELINLGVTSLIITDGDKDNLSRTLKQGDNKALSIQLQDGYGMSKKQADDTEGTSCKSATIYWELKLNGADVGTYAEYYEKNVKAGNIIEHNAYVRVSTENIAKQYDSEEYEYRTKIIRDYGLYKSGDGGELGETRIVTKHVGGKEEKWHSIMTYSSENDGTRVISDTGARGYGKSASKLIKANDGNRKQYFKYYEYIEKTKKNKSNNKEKND